MRGDIMHRIDPKIGKYGKKIYSQNNEDGIIEYLCKALGISRGYFVEFGAVERIARNGWIGGQL
jgi:hypothetical protein